MVKKFNRKIRKVFMICINRGIQQEPIKIVSNERLAEYYLTKYEEKYPTSELHYEEIDFVEAIK